MNAPERPAVAAAVIVQKGRVLLIRRAAPEGALLWQLPAGQVEPGESGEQAAVREVREETGLDVSVVKTLGERVHPESGRRMIYVLCDVIDGTAHAAATKEVAEVEWCDRAATANHVPSFFKPVQELLDATLT